MPNTSPANQQTGSSGAEAGRRWLRTDNILLVASLAFFVWFTGDVLLLVFAGLLLAVGLDGLASSVKSWTPLSHGWALLAVLILLAAFLAVIGMTVVPQFLAQLDQLWETLVGFAERAQETLSRYEWAQRLMQDSEGGGGAAEAASAIARQAASAMLAALGVASSLVILLAIAIFAAANPGLYRRGVLALLPPGRRARVEEALAATGHALRWWFLAQIIAMIVLGATVAVGLMIIGVDVWLSLGVLAGLIALRTSGRLMAIRHTPSAMASLTMNSMPISRAVRFGAKVLILDEPTFGQDRRTAAELLAIGRRCANALKGKPVKRVVFHEITKAAVNEAIAHPREVAYDLVNAQQARRALDYLVGFTLSPLLWRKLPGSRSAGRVQSVALRLVCDREAEIERFRPQEYWSVGAKLNEKGKSFEARLYSVDGKVTDKLDIKTGDEATALQRISERIIRIERMQRNAARRRPE